MATKIIWWQTYLRTVCLPPGPWFNIKMSSYQYRKSHCGDKTVVRSSYLHNGISYTGKMTSLYWISPLILFEGTPGGFLNAVLVYRYVFLFIDTVLRSLFDKNVVSCDTFTKYVELPELMGDYLGICGSMKRSLLAHVIAFLGAMLAYHHLNHTK